MNIKALIPVRKGSKRVKNKNIKPFAGSNLLKIKINQLKKVKLIKEIVVNSDCDEMLSIAKKSGVTTVKRPDFFATDECSINDAWKNMAENINAEHILYTNVTNPLINSSTYDLCIDKYLSLKNNQSLNTVTAIKEFLWLENKPLNYNPFNQPRSQDLPLVYYPNFAINLIKKNVLIKNKNIFSNNFYPFYLNKIESIDIDDEEDFKIAEIIYKEINLK